MLKQFDDVLTEFIEVNKVKPFRQKSIEMAMKDYVYKLKRQIEVLKEAVSQLDFSSKELSN